MSLERTAKTEKQPSVVDRLLAVIDDAIDSGLDHLDACAQALEWLKRQGLASELMAEQGVALISYLHRTHPRAMAPAAWTTPGRSKVDATLVNRAHLAFREYEAVVNKRIGDCTEDDLTTLAEHRKELARANALAADRYLKLRAELRKTKAKTVAAAFKNNLAAFLKIYRGVSDAS